VQQSVHKVFSPVRLNTIPGREFLVSSRKHERERDWSEMGRSGEDEIEVCAQG